MVEEGSIVVGLYKLKLTQNSISSAQMSRLAGPLPENLSNFTGCFHGGSNSA